jgi:hypothetical protein
MQPFFLVKAVEALDRLPLPAAIQQQKMVFRIL